MKIVVNGQQKTVESGTSVSTLVLQLGLVVDGIAVAVNHRVIPRTEHASFILSSRDQIEIVKAVGGG